MADSTIKLTFLRDATHDEHIHFEMYDLDDDVPGGLVLLVTETWKDGPRVALKTVPTVISTAPTDVLPAGGTVKKYKDSINLDYGTANFFTFVSGNEITFTAAYRPGVDVRWGFRNFFVSPASGLATATITNDVPNPLSIVSEAFVSGNCSTYGLLTETNIQITEAIINGNHVPVTTNPFTLTLQRNINNTVYYVEDTTAYNERVSNIANPIYYGSLAIENTTISIEQSIAGATITISVINAQNLSLEYSIDGSSWQSSNIFSGVANGNYTLNVRDNLSCQIAVPFEVTSDGTKSPFHFISKANSLNFVLQQETSSCDIPKNDENTFAFQNIAQLPDCTETLIQTCDITTTQFKSNFDTVSAFVHSEDGNIHTVTVEKKSANTNRFESMDCTMYNYGTNQSGIYFTEGNMYDEGWLPNGDTYALNGNLPDFAVLGNIIELDGIGTFEIVAVLFDDRASVRKKVIVIDYYYTGTESLEKIACIYNLLPYEIYQFVIDWSLFVVGIYEVEVKMEDAQLETIIYTSENIILSEEHKGTVRIDYYNSNNRDIFYKYGIEHRIRVPFISIQAVPNDEQEISLTDNGAYVVDSIIYEADKITFEYMVKSMMRKVSIALGCQYVFVNGVGYAGDGGIEFEPIGQTNLYDVSKTMVKSNVSYNTRHTGANGVSGDYIRFNIPALIAYGQGLIKQ